MSALPNPMDTSQWVAIYTEAAKYYTGRSNKLIEEDYAVKLKNWKMGYVPGTPPPPVPMIVLLDSAKLNQYYSSWELQEQGTFIDFAGKKVPLPVDPKELEPPAGFVPLPVPNSPLGDEDGDSARRLAAVGVDLNDLTTGFRWTENGVTWEWRRRANPFNRLDGRWHRV